MNYSDPNSIIDAGRQAYISGMSNLDCPIDRRTSANAVCLWMEGWQEECGITCKGTNCKAKKGIGHSQQCHKEHDQTVNGKS
jgi:ribosome modulation factor